MADLPKDKTTPVNLYVINEKNRPIFDVTAVIHPKLDISTIATVHLGTVLPNAMSIGQTLIPN
jgi:hypothetical protein